MPSRKNRSLYKQWSWFSQWVKAVDSWRATCGNSKKPVMAVRYLLHVVSHIEQFERRSAETLDLLTVAAI